jgi:hypothetical protein
VPALGGWIGVVETLIVRTERHFAGAGYNGSAQDHRHRRWAGRRLACRDAAAGDLADAAGLPAAFGEALRPLRERRSCHDPGRVLVDVAVMLADGGEAISDLAVLRDQPGLFGTVASTATAWRVLDGIDEDVLTGLRAARAVARERAWWLRAEADRDLPASTAGGRWCVCL